MRALRDSHPSHRSCLLRQRPLSRPNQTLSTEAGEFQVALLFGLGGSLVALVTTLQAGGPATTVLLALAWTSAWLAGAFHPEAAIWLLGRWRWTVPLVTGLSVLTILASDGFDSLLKAEANWLAWAAPVVLSTRRACLAIAGMLSGGLLTAFVLDGMSLHLVVSGPDRYTAVTDIVNPIVIVLVAVAFTGVFRAVLAGASESLRRAREGGPASSPGMSALLAGRPVLALPPGSLPSDDQGEDEPGRPVPAVWLSRAEREIVSLLAEGHTPQQIALQRQRSVETVYDQIASAKRKAAARTIEHLVARAWHPPS